MGAQLSGKVALVTGGSSGIGAAIVIALLEAGARVVVSARRTERLHELSRKLAVGTDRCHTVESDVRDEASAEDLIRRTLAWGGKLDILINNAGIFRIEGVEDATLEQWHQVIAINQTGVWLGMKAAVPAMRAAGGGSIVNISSIGGLVGFGEAAAYQSTKGAVRLLTKTAAIEYAEEGIRVNSVHPGTIDTDMVKGIPPAHLEALIAKHGK